MRLTREALARESQTRQNEMAQELSNAELADELRETFASQSLWASCVRHEAARRLDLLAQIGPR